MKKSLCLLCVVVVVSGLLSSSALALTPLGPPMSRLKLKQQSLGFLFASSEMDLKMSGYGFTETMKDTESTSYLVKAGYGVLDGVELFVLVGSSDLSSEDFDGDSDVAWGFGSKFTLAKQGSVTWGGVFQFCSISSEGIVFGDVPGFGWQAIAIDAQLFDIQIAVGPTYTREGFSIYGGPFLHFVDGDLDGSALGETVTFDIEQKSEFGGYIGAMFDLAESSSLFFEYQMTGDASAIAGGIVFRF